mmetsp:Transcript_366/g.626  ORF Transcript_366/g.626 Transcript_366/m.626 type:complete len:207 (+) Transcript_366:591-1211(+)
MKLPRYETDQLFTSSIGVTFFSWRAAVTTAVLPVNRSLPESTTINRPKGRPKAPVMIFANPGFTLAISKQCPPTKVARKIPKPIWIPATMPLTRMVTTSAWPFAVPAATNLVYVAAGASIMDSAFTSTEVARGRSAGLCALNRGRVVPNTLALEIAGRTLAMFTRARHVVFTRMGVRMAAIVLIAIDIVRKNSGRFLGNLITPNNE